MSQKVQKKFIDRLQFLGVIGPFVVLLTLFSALLYGSKHGWYLFAATLLGLPLSWKWSLRGYLATIGALSLLYLCMMPFFTYSEKLWQMGASMSLAVGLFTTFLGFEEIKMMMTDLQVESQSRLDNLIELDDKFNRSQKDWDISEENFKTEIREKNLLIEKLSGEADALEKTTQVMEAELLKLQSQNNDFIHEIEQKVKLKSRIEMELMEKKEELANLRKELSLSQSEREGELKAENGKLSHRISDLENQLYEIEEKIHEQQELESNMNKEATQQVANIKKMENSLREKVSELYELREQLSTRDKDVAKQQEEIDLLIKKVEGKEHELLNLRNQISEGERKLSGSQEKVRDLEQDLLLAQKHLQERENNLKAVQEKLTGKETLALALEQKLESKNKEIENLYQDLEAEGKKLGEYLEREKKTALSKQNYEAKIVEIQSQLNKEKKKQFKELAKLNEARFALFQADLDKERLKAELFKEKESPQKTVKKAPRHWFLEIESILKQDKPRRIDLEKLPKDLSNEIVTLNQTKAMYKQLRLQFEEKNKVLDEVREKLFKAETDLEKLTKKRNEELASESKLENELEKDLFVKEQEISSIEDEVKDLNLLIQNLFKELEQGQA